MGANSYLKIDDSHRDQVGVNGESEYVNYISILGIESTEPVIFSWDKEEGSIKDDIQTGFRYE